MHLFSAVCCPFIVRPVYCGVCSHPVWNVKCSVCVCVGLYLSLSVSLRLLKPAVFIEHVSGSGKIMYVSESGLHGLFLHRGLVRVALRNLVMSRTYALDMQSDSAV